MTALLPCRARTLPPLGRSPGSVRSYRSPTPAEFPRFEWRLHKKSDNEERHQRRAFSTSGWGSVPPCGCNERDHWREQHNSAKLHEDRNRQGSTSDYRARGDDLRDLMDRAAGKQSSPEVAESKRRGN